MNKKKNIDIETESKQDKFRRIINTRTKILGSAYNRITRMPKQNSYEISQEDAIQLLSYVNTFHDAFIKKYQPIADGQKISKSDELNVSNVF